MDVDLAVGWIGLGGAAIGAGAAVLGGWLQQRAQAKADREQRREERRYSNGQAALEMLIRFREANMRRTEDPGGMQDFTEALVEFVMAFDAALYVVSDAEEMRRRVLGIMRVAADCIDLTRTHPEAKRWAQTMCTESIRVLSAFLREEPLPRPSTEFLEHRQIIRAHNQAQSDAS
jgi:hypothetical protein